MKRVLFLCSRNLLRSPTAEDIFSNYPGVECASAGLSVDAENPVAPELIEWADLIFVMEKIHKKRLSERFMKHLRNVQVICLDIPDKYEYMDPDLINILKEKVSRFL